MPSWKGPTSNLRPRRARNSTTTRNASSRMAIAGSGKSPKRWSSTRRFDDEGDEGQAHPVRYWQCALAARIISGGGFHLDNYRLGPEAGERLGWVTGWAGASRQRSPLGG